LFADEDEAMVSLGVGKNMVRSIRFWAECSGMIAALGRGKGGHEVTDLGLALLDPKKGLDPYLEDDQTLWLLHWQLANSAEPLLAWDFLLNKWHEPDLVPSVIYSVVERELESSARRISPSSIKSHFAVFFHSYYPTRGARTGAEDSLDSPLVELGLLEHRCDRAGPDGRMERIYAFRRGPKPEISNWLFAYALLRFWHRECRDEETLSFRQVAYDRGSPGQVFRLDEQDLRARLDWLGSQSELSVIYSNTSLIQALHRSEPWDEAVLSLARQRIYRR
jgi:hypothetical protein